MSLSILDYETFHVYEDVYDLFMWGSRKKKKTGLLFDELSYLDCASVVLANVARCCFEFNKFCI